jgi:ABC-type enterochelin transport system ATPase subunit
MRMNGNVTNERDGATPGSLKLNEEQARRLDDILWAIHDPDVISKYADEVVAVFQRKIIAHGRDEETVLAEAQRLTGLPKHQIPITTILGPATIFAPRD